MARRFKAIIRLTQTFEIETDDYSSVFDLEDAIEQCEDQNDIESLSEYCNLTDHEAEVVEIEAIPCEDDNHDLTITGVHRTNTTVMVETSCDQCGFVGEREIDVSGEAGEFDWTAPGD